MLRVPADLHGAEQQTVEPQQEVAAPLRETPEETVTRCQPPDRRTTAAALSKRQATKCHAGCGQQAQHKNKLPLSGERETRTHI